MSDVKPSTKNAFPAWSADHKPGMTYREWLIGQIASGYFLSEEASTVAAEIVNQADAILDILDDQAKKSAQ
jgi:hypothetical protein